MLKLFWKHAVWIDFEERANANWSDYEFFLSLRFTNVLRLDEEKLELLYEQFHEYKTMMPSYLKRHMRKLFCQEQVMVIIKSTELM